MRQSLFALVVLCGFVACSDSPRPAPEEHAASATPSETAATGQAEFPPAPAPNTGPVTSPAASLATLPAAASAPESPPPPIRKSGERPSAGNALLEKKAAVGGHVVDEQNRPVPDVTITAILLANLPAQHDPAVWSNAKSDEQGRFAFKDRMEGPAQLCADSKNHVPVTMQIAAPSTNLVIRMDSKGASLEGYVFLKTTGTGISGAGVVAGLDLSSLPSDSPFRHVVNTSTDENGFYRFSHLMSETYCVGAAKEGLLSLLSGGPEENIVSLGAGEVRTGYNLFLFPGHIIRGKVTDHEKGEPLEGVHVALVPNVNVETTTREDGTYVLETGQRNSQYSFSAEKEGYLFYSTKGQQSPWVILKADELEATLDFEMLAGVSISGVVKDSSANPIGGAKVVGLFFGDKAPPASSAVSATDGTFRFFSYPSVYLRLKATAPDFAFGLSNEIELKNDPISGVEITLAPGAAASGVVLDPQENPVARASVWASVSYGFEITGRSFGMWENRSQQRSDGIGQVETDAYGHFEFKNLPSLPLKLGAEKEGYANAKVVELTLRPDERRSDVQLILLQSHHIAGRVTDTEGAAVADIDVRANMPSPGEQTSLSARTDEDGKYRIEKLADGKAEVSVHSEKYQYEKVSEIPVDRDDVDFVLRYKETGDPEALIGKVVDWKTHAALTDFSVSSESELKIARDPSTPGQFLVEGVQRNITYHLRIELPGYLTIKFSFHIQESGSPFAQTFEMGQGGTVKGRILSHGARAPLAGVRAELRETDDVFSSRPPERVVETDEGGRFVFRSVAPGNRFFKFTNGEEPQLTFRKIQVAHAGEEDLGDIVLGGGKTLRGRIVRDSGGQPIAGAKIEARGVIASIALNAVAQSDEEGRFEFADLTDDYYNLYAPEYHTGTGVDIRFGGIPDVVLRVGTTSVTGMVLYRGKPHPAGISFNIYKENLHFDVNTNAEGKYSAPLPPGLWDVTIFSKENNDFRLYDKLEISGVGRVEKTFRMSGGRILGRVIDAESKPIPNLQVGAGLAHSPMPGVTQRSPMGGRSARDGTFLIIGLEPGAYNVAANADKLGAGRVENVQVPLDGDSQQVVLQIGVQEGVTVVSKVLDANTGKPVLNSWVRLLSKDPLGAVSFERRHNSEGLARIENVPAGIYMFSAGADGYSWARRDLEVKIGPATQFEDALYAVGWLRWTFVDREGHVVEGVSCRLTPNDPESVEQVRDGVTRRDGTFTQTGLEPGDYAGTATFPDGSIMTETFTISAGKLTEKVTERD